ncbi:MAG: N-acetylmuramoyl-L-alanine amidase [Actinobacteria bacterium]|nr:N-acetylmuramoyl-L-alanine amidase [Actinomycetota bacterium]
MKRLSLGLLLVLWATPAAGAGVTLVSRDVPLGNGRLLSGGPTPAFNMVGLHWQGDGSVSFRTRAADGPWSRWRAAMPEAEDQPDRRSVESRTRRGWRVGNPYWTGDADGIQYRLRGTVRRLRAQFVSSTATAVPSRQISLAGSPGLISRVGWDADERIRRGPPLYASAVRVAVVHHTAGANGYSRAQSTAIVRGIQAYHVKSNGWNDIGYNFLVDRFGQVFEGRYGGVERNVVGAHAEGFNTGSVGVALIGNYAGAAVSSAALTSLSRLLAWRLDVAHVDPRTTLTFLSRGNPRYPASVPVFLRALSGHRDTGFTDCPGNLLYGRLAEIAGIVSATGLPKLYAPSARGTAGQRVRFTGRLSTALPWTVTVTDALGKPVASGSGVSARIDWTWDATKVARKVYRYAIEAGPSVRPVRGTVGEQTIVSPPPPPTVSTALLSAVSASPTTVTPNGDGTTDTTTVTYTLAAPAQVTVHVADEAGRILSTLFSERRDGGKRSFRFTAEAIPDGIYKIMVSATGDDGQQLSVSVRVIVSRVLRGFSVAPAAFSPNSDGRRDELALTFELLGPAEVKLRVLKAGKWAASPFTGALPAGPQKLLWDGRRSAGRLLDGRYTAAITVTDALSSVTQELPFTADTIAPKLGRIAGAAWRLRISEPATVTIVSGGRRITLDVKAAGVFLVPRRGVSPRARVYARDAAGNAAKPLSVP